MSELYLKMENHAGRTVVSDCRFTAPLKVAKPFYRDDHTEVMIMQASAGLLSGDEYNITIDVAEGAEAAVTGQSYAKLFHANGGAGARQRVRIDVGDGASLCWFPSPVIPFAGSRYKSQSDIYLHENARFFLCDILACGRVGKGERFAFESFRSRTAVHVGTKLVFLDNTRLIPNECDTSGTGFFEGHTHIGLLYLYGCGDIKLPETAAAEVSMSDSAAGKCVRLLADSAQVLADYARAIAPQNRR
ncbi:MAG: urease accessory protein UreD [Oscillospiraceae bacterium]|nr:urease accessory protein UreD [Oscillospiraceae bacterium]